MKKFEYLAKMCFTVVVLNLIMCAGACSSSLRYYENYANRSEPEVTVTTSVTTGTSAVVTSRATTVDATTTATNSTTVVETLVTEPYSVVHEELVTVENPVESVEPEVTGYSIEVSSLERDYLIHAVHHEAGNQSHFAKMAECSTILNRCHMSGTGVIEVLTAPDQYPMDYSELIYCDSCAEAVDEVLSSGVNIPEDVIYAFATYSSSSWLWSREIYCIDGECVFAR